MSSLKELLTSIKIQQATQNESYVSYDKKDHKIYKITNRRPLETDYEVVAVSSDIVKPILEGSKSVSDYTVVYDFSSKQVVVKELNYEDHYNSAGSFIHEFTRTSVAKDSHSNFDKIYDGVSIDIWIKQDAYQKNQLVYYKGNIYKLLKINKENQDFNFNDAVLFVEDVKLTTASTTDHIVSLEINTSIFEGIHIDVWYKELDHITGQHVYYKGTVYKCLKDQKKNTNFNKENFEIILEDVKLYNDENKLLNFQDVTQIGDKFLDYNKLYMRDLHEIAHNREFGEVFFYSGNNLIEVKDNEISVINLTTSDIYSVDRDFLNIKSLENLKNGSKVLIGKELYRYEIDKTFDLVVRQNNKLKRWEFMLNPYTKKFLKLSGYSTDDVVYFSITEKYDPNILYKSITISVQELIDNKECYIPYDKEWNPADYETSLYTTKYFGNYGHEVID